MILAGARKCRACRSWLVEPPRSRTLPKGHRGLTLIVAAVVAVGAVLISQRRSPVGEAPPLTPLEHGSAVVSARVAGPGPPAGDAAAMETLGAEEQAAEEEAKRRSTDAPLWKPRRLSIDVHPLDLVFHPSGKTLYVSGNDATLWEYDLATGKVLHMTTLPAQGDHIRLLNDRYLAIIRHHDAGHIPLLDTEHWERDPKLLYVGAGPADIIALPDRKTAVAASSRGRRLSLFDLESGRRQGNILLPHAVEHLFLLRAGDRPYVGAMGQQIRGDGPAGAFMDIFDPAEKHFGATRRSVSVGREPRPGAVTADQSTIFFADRVSNQAIRLRLDETTRSESVAVGQSPEAAFLLGDERFGITLNSQARTATVVDLHRMERTATLMLKGSPRFGARTPDGRTLFVSLGGTAWPPKDSGAVIIAGDPPKVIATLETDKGASRVATAPGSGAAAVANYWDKSVTMIER